MIARLRAKQAPGCQHGWVAVEKHEMPSWIDTFRHVEKKITRIVIHRKKLGGHYHKILDKSMTAV